MSNDLRRHLRVALRSPVRVMWQDRNRNQKFALARTLDISQSGIRVELPEAVELLSTVGIQSDRLGLSCSGLVRSCTRCGARYLVGVEFGGTVQMSRSARSLIETSPPLDAQQHNLLR